MCNTQCENFAESLHQSHRCSSWHLSRLWPGVMGGGGAFLGSTVLPRAKQGPRVRLRASFVGHKALSVLGKAMRMEHRPELDTERRF